MYPRLRVVEGWTTVILLLVMFLCVAWSIQMASWTAEGLSVLQGIVLLGGVTGIVLAKSRLPNQMSHLLGGLSGLTWGTYLTSQALSDAESWKVAVVELNSRLTTWIYRLIYGGTSGDDAIFVLFLCFLLWLLAYFCAWAVFRWHRVWWAVIVCALALLANVYYAPRNLGVFLFAYLFCSLLLVVRFNVFVHEQEWEASRVGYSSDVIWSFSQAGLALTAILLVLSWLTPTALASKPLNPVWERMGEPWRRVQNQWNRVFFNLNYGNEPAFSYFGRAMRFGGPVNLSDTPLFEVKATTGRYWRAMVFHEYTGNGWINTDVNTVLVEEDEAPLTTMGYELRREVTQTVTLLQNTGPDGLLVAAGQPVRAGLPIRAVVDPLPSEAGVDEQSPVEISILYATRPLARAETYQVVSSLTKADVESLREAGTEVPEWVMERYLQLPDSLPQRIRDLAVQVTWGRETPYEKVEALERFLRTFRYDETIQAPPAEADGVAYFLFDVKAGYCDYYASSLVVMARSLGIPARYVRGYSQGQYEDGVYHVRELNGHAWPEVYFAGYGWVEFEPTAAQPVIERPNPQDESSSDTDRSRPSPMRDPFSFGDIMPDDADEPLYDPSLSAAQTGVEWREVIAFLLLGVAAGLLGVIVLLHRPSGELSLAELLLGRPIPGQQQPLSLAEWAYTGLLSLSRRLFGLVPRPHQTPFEFAARVGHAVPSGAEPVDQIASAYVQERFSPRAAAGEEGEPAGSGLVEALHMLRPAMLRRWVARWGEDLRQGWLRLGPRPIEKEPWTKSEAKKKRGARRARF
jgi:transglutaminase-like putative cysteine protease